MSKLELSAEQLAVISNNMFGGVNFTIRAYSNVIGADGTGGAEITAAGYVPIAVTNNLTTFPAADAANTSRSNAVKLPDPFMAITENFSILSYGIFKTSNGEFLGRKVLDAPYDVTDGQSFGFPVGSFTYEGTSVLT